MTRSAGTARRGLLVLLIVTWAISWPVIKLGVAAMPPLWYACLRYAIATACLLAVAGLARRIRVAAAAGLVLDRDLGHVADGPLPSRSRPGRWHIGGGIRFASVAGGTPLESARAEKVRRRA